MMEVVVTRVYMLFMNDFMLMFRTCDWSGVLWGRSGAEVSGASCGHLDRYHR